MSQRFTRFPSWLLGQAAAHAGRMVSEGFAAAGARGLHYRLLDALDESGPDSQADLGRRSGIHLSDLVAALNELESEGCVQRSPNAQDRRRNVITITPAGRRRLKRLEKQISKVQEDLLAPLSAGERKQLTELLAALVEFHRNRAAPGPM